MRKFFLAITLLIPFFILSGCGGSGTDQPAELSIAYETIQPVLQSAIGEHRLVATRDAAAGLHCGMSTRNAMRRFRQCLPLISPKTS